MEQRFDVMLEPLRVFLGQVGDFLPRLGLALIILIAGWLIAKMIRFAINRGLRKVNFHVVTDRAGIDAFLRDGGIGLDATEILAVLVYWIVILTALLIRVGFTSQGLEAIAAVMLLFLANPALVNATARAARRMDYGGVTALPEEKGD